MYHKRIFFRIYHLHVLGFRQHLLVSHLIDLFVLKNVCCSGTAFLFQMLLLSILPLFCLFFATVESQKGIKSELQSGHNS